MDASNWTKDWAKATARLLKKNSRAEYVNEKRSVNYRDSKGEIVLYRLKNRKGFELTLFVDDVVFKTVEFSKYDTAIKAYRAVRDNLVEGKPNTPLDQKLKGFIARSSAKGKAKDRA